MPVEDGSVRACYLMALGQLSKRSRTIKRHARPPPVFDAHCSAIGESRLVRTPSANGGAAVPGARPVGH